VENPSRVSLRDFRAWSNFVPAIEPQKKKSPGQKRRLSPRLRQADPFSASPNLYVQPRSRKNKNRMGIGIPRSHSKIYPVAPVCSIRLLSFVTIPFLAPFPAFISQEEGLLRVWKIYFFRVQKRGLLVRIGCCFFGLEEE
jgi:hypothetical protein